MKKKIILSSIMTIALCLCIITGSTFALFTSGDEINIAVTAGKVALSAKITGMRVYTSFEKPYVDIERYVDETDPFVFENGGTAKYDVTENKLTLTNVTPGDAVDLVITMDNDSNVAIKYLVVCTITSKDTEYPLSEVLKITVDGRAASGTGETVNSGWIEWAPSAGENTIDVSLTILLPASVGNDYQESTADISFAVYAVQGNVTDANANEAFGLK